MRRGFRHGAAAAGLGRVRRGSRRGAGSAGYCAVRPEPPATIWSGARTMVRRVQLGVFGTGGSFPPVPVSTGISRSQYCLDSALVNGSLMLSSRIPAC